MAKGQMRSTKEKKKPKQDKNKKHKGLPPHLAFSLGGQVTLGEHKGEPHPGPLGKKA